MYDLESDDISADWVNTREMYDLSNYMTTHRKYIAYFALNRANEGLMKDKAAGSIISASGCDRICFPS